MPPGGESGLEAATAARQRAEEALDRSERRSRALVEHSLGLICVHDLDGRLISVNPAAARSLGYGPGEGVGDPVRNFLVPETRPLFDEYLQRIRAHGKDAGLMRVAARDDTERIWMYSNILYEDDDQPYVLGHALDISDRIRAERALRDQEQALQAAYAALDVRVQERTQLLVLANARLEAEIAERRQAEAARERALLRERDTLAFVAHVTDELSSVPDATQLTDALCRLPVPFLADASLLHLLNDDGSVRTLAGGCVAAGGATGLDRLADATSGPLDTMSAVARALHEQRPQMLSWTPGEHSPLYMGDRDGRVAAAMDAIGIRSIAILPVAIDQRPFAALSLMSLADEISPNDLALATELVRRFRLAYGRAQMLVAAREANRLKEEFLSTLSHELRTPLNAIMGWARILRVSPLDPGVARGLDVIERNAEAQARLIEDILDVSRIVSGKLRLQWAPVRIAETARAALETIRPAAQARQITLHDSCAGPATVLGDAARLQQVAINLLSNAVKFTNDGGSITLTVKETGGGVEIDVADTGIGIRREVLPLVFERFRQADSSAARRHGGLGIGLAIVRHLVDLHGGHVSAYSAGEGQGSRFTVWLPATPAVDPPSAGFDPDRYTDRSRDSAASAVLEPLAGLRGRRVLVVDDDADARLLLASLLGGAGAHVVTAESTRTAMEAIGREVPELVLADIGMPDEDGYVFISRMRTLAPDRGGRVPAIAVTAYARAEDRDRALAAGFNRHVAKPIDPGALLRLIATIE